MGFFWGGHLEFSKSAILKFFFASSLWKIQPFYMRYHFFLHYGWFFQNFGKEAVRTFMHTTVPVIYYDLQWHHGGKSDRPPISVQYVLKWSQIRGTKRLPCPQWAKAGWRPSGIWSLFCPIRQRIAFISMFTVLCWVRVSTKLALVLLETSYEVSKIQQAQLASASLTPPCLEATIVRMTHCEN